MKKVLLSAVSIVSLGLAMSAAQAADVIPEPVPVATWTGFHVGVGGGVGYNFYDANSEALLFLDEDGDGEPDPESFVLGNFIDGDDLGAWYGFGTVEVGFDYQFDNSPFVIGILANYDFNGNSDADASSSTFLDFDPPLISLDNSIEAGLDDSWFVGGRLGFVFNDDTLIYGLGGYTWVDGKVKAEHALNIEGTEVEGISVDEDESVDGFTLGAGIEHLITANLSLKLEYRHDFLDDIDFEEIEVFEDAGPEGEDLALTQEGNVDFSRDTIRAVLSWRFNPFE